MDTLIFRTLLRITAQVGDVVARCDFDNVVNNDGSLTTGCRDIDFAYYGEARFITDSSSDSADTGPSADHTGDGGKRAKMELVVGLIQCHIHPRVSAPSPHNLALFH